MSDVIESCRTEVLEFHRALEEWLRGDKPHTRAETARMERALAPGCVLIAPGGVLDSRDSLLSRLFLAHGSAPDMRIQVEDFAPVWAEGSMALVRYVEWRHFAGQTTGRYSTVLFRSERDAPAGVVWLHIHETWMAGHGPSASPEK
jgi:hypothetical protein